jgi:hypothetical protein
MFQIFEQCFTKDELAWFHSDMQDLKIKGKKQDTSEKQYRDLTTQRWELPRPSAVRECIEKKISQLLPQHQIGFLAYSEQSQPSRLHCDSHGGKFGATCIIPLKEYGDGNDQTLVFDKLSKDGQTMQDINEELQKEMTGKNPKNRNSHTYKLEHITDNKKMPNPCNWLEFVGVFPYKHGNMVAFDKRLLHCSNNWLATDPKRKNKDFIIMHTYEKQNKT